MNDSAERRKRPLDRANCIARKRPLRKLNRGTNHAGIPGSRAGFSARYCRHFRGSQDAVGGPVPSADQSARSIARERAPQSARLEAARAAVSNELRARRRQEDLALRCAQRSEDSAGAGAIELARDVVEQEDRVARRARPAHLDLGRP